MEAKLLNPGPSLVQGNQQKYSNSSSQQVGYRYATGLVVGSYTEATRILNTVGHGAQSLGVLRFVTGDNVGVEIPFVRIDNDNLLLAFTPDDSIDAADTYDLMRLITATSGVDGDVGGSSSSSGNNQQQYTVAYDIFDDDGGTLDGSTGGATWTQIVNNSTADVTEIEVHTNMGQVLEFSTDGVTRHLLIGRNGTNGKVPFVLATTGDLYVRAVGADITAAATGERDMQINFYGGNTATETVRVPIFHDFTATSVGTGAWVEIDSAIAEAATSIEILNASGVPLELATGGAGSEATQLLIGRGGNSGVVPISLAAGQRLSLRSLVGTANSGEIILNLYR